MGSAETVGERILSGNSGLDYGDGVEGGSRRGASCWEGAIIKNLKERYVAEMM